MGDRGNIKVYQNDENNTAVYLYTHWRGSEIYGILKKALAKKWRWDDPAYLTRIIFDVMTEGDHGEETGFGISTSVCDNEHTIIGVNCEKQQVSFEDEAGNVKSFLSFEAFVNRQDKWSPEGEIP